MNKVLVKSGILFFIVLLTASCVTFEQRVLVRPVSDDFPVSASSSIYWNGRVYTSEDYSVVRGFEYSAVLESPVLGRETIELDMSDDLAGMLHGTGADGVVNLTFELLNIDKGPLALMDISQMVIGIGLGNLGYGIYVQLVENPDLIAITLGGAGATALGLGGYFLARATGKITYVYRVSGTLVSLER